MLILKPTERVQVLKNSTRISQNSSPFERCFYVTFSGHFEHFQYFNCKTDFWNMKTFFKKMEYLFLVESSKNENTSFPYDTAISEANFKINRMVSKKWTYHKEWSFASNYFIFFENFV